MVTFSGADWHVRVGLCHSLFLLEHCFSGSRINYHCRKNNPHTCIIYTDIHTYYNELVYGLNVYVVTEPKFEN